MGIYLFNHLFFVKPYISMLTISLLEFFLKAFKFYLPI